MKVLYIRELFLCGLEGEDCVVMVVGRWCGLGYGWGRLWIDGWMRVCGVVRIIYCGCGVECLME